MNNRTMSFGNRFAILGLTEERKVEVVDYVGDMSWPKRSFYMLVVLSSTIAAYGLLSNSTAIVIGAMLVAPLMGPIFGVALSITTGNRPLMSASIVAETIGVALAVAIPLLIGALPLRVGLGPEVIARTNPTLYDIIVALAAGTAGAYAVVNSKISPALPGVAISTSLVPPLAACGLCISDGRFDQAMGAFLLFTANFVAIELAAGAVFIISGIEDFSSKTGAPFGHVLRRFGISLMAFLGMACFMTHTLLQVTEARRLSDSVEKNLYGQLTGVLGASISEIDVRRQSKQTRVIAVVLSPHAIESDMVRSLEQNLRKQLRTNINLIVRSLPSADFDKNGPVFLEDEEMLRARESQEVKKFLSQASSAITDELRDIPGATMTDIRTETRDGTSVLSVVLRTPQVLDSGQVARLQDAVASKTGERIKLLVRSVLTQDVDADGPIYTRSCDTTPPSEEDKRLRDRLKSAIRNQTSNTHPGTELTELFVHPSHDQVIAIAELRTPAPFIPPEVGHIENLLRRHVDPRVHLIVRCRIESDVSASGYHRKSNVDRLTGRQSQ